MFLRRLLQRGVMCRHPTQAQCAARKSSNEKLVEILTFLRTGSGELKVKDFDWAYKRMKRTKPIELLNLIRGSGGNLCKQSQESIEKALHVRNFLAHEFFHKYNPIMSATECKYVCSRLQKLKSELKAAFDLLQPLRKKLEIRLGLAAERQGIWENFQERVTGVFASFIDE